MIITLDIMFEIITTERRRKIRKNQSCIVEIMSLITPGMDTNPNRDVT